MPEVPSTDSPYRLPSLFIPLYPHLSCQSLHLPSLPPSLPLFSHPVSPSPILSPSYWQHFVVHDVLSWVEARMFNC